MEQKLLKSFLTLIVFYSSVFLAWWIASKGLSIDVIMNEIMPVDDSQPGFFAFIVENVVGWTIPMMGAVFVAFFIGLKGYDFHVKRRILASKERLKSSEYHGVKSSLGKLPDVEWKSLDKISGVGLTFSNEVSNIFTQLPETHQNLFREVVALLADNPDAFVGPGHKGTLLEHSIRVLLEAVKVGDKTIADPLALIVVIAHDAGKIISHERAGDDASWIRNGNHDEFSGLLLSSLPSFPKLSLEDRQVLLLALKYSHKRNRTPILDKESAQSRLSALQDLLTHSDRETTKKEKESILKEMDVNSLMDEIFDDVLSSCLFMSGSTRPGTRVEGFRRGKTQAFLVENQFRQKLLSRMNDEQVAVFNKGKRNKNKMAVVTQHLISYFRKKGWLVDKVEGFHAPHGLWNVTSGEVLLKGMILIELPKEKLGLLPNEMPKYEMEIKGPTHVSSKNNRGYNKHRNTNNNQDDNRKPRALNQPRKKESEGQDADNKNNNERPENESRTPNSKGSSKAPNHESSTNREGGHRRLERGKSQRPADKEKLSVLEALESKRDEIAKASKQEIEEARKRMSNKLEPYAHSLAELNFNLEQRRLETESPYFIAQLEPKIGVSKEVGKERSEERNYNNSSHLAMVMATLG